MSSSLVKWFCDALWRWHMRRKTIRALSALNDHQLKDIGVERSEIPCVADECLPPPAPLRLRGDRRRRHCFH